MDLTTRITAIVREWDQWSPAERERLEDVTAEILDHCRNGNGNEFIREFCNRVLVPRIPGMVRT